MLRTRLGDVISRPGYTVTWKLQRWKLFETQGPYSARGPCHRSWMRVYGELGLMSIVQTTCSQKCAVLRPRRYRRAEHQPSTFQNQPALAAIPRLRHLVLSRFIGERGGGYHSRSLVPGEKVVPTELVPTDTRGKPGLILRGFREQTPPIKRHSHELRRT